MVDIHDTITIQIEQGRLTLPTITGYADTFGDDIQHLAEAFFKALWYHYLKNADNATTSTVYWAKRFANPKAFNVLLMTLSQAGWITVLTQPSRNWSEVQLNEAKLLEYVSATTLESTRKFAKLTEYTLETYDATFIAKEDYNGVYRPGFAMASTVPFKFNTGRIAANMDLFTSEVNKGINKTIERYPSLLGNKANYATISSEIVESYANHDATYMSGQNRLDPRGRDIAGYLNRVGNPVGYKVMRQNLVIPKGYRNKATAKGVKNKFLAIAELSGFRMGTISTKLDFGRECYYSRKMTNNPVHNIGLENTYEDLDNAFDIANNRFKQFIVKLYNDDTRRECDKVTLSSLVTKVETLVDYYWIYPIEIDMSASVLGYLGLLLGHAPYLERCNIIKSETLNDAWGSDKITNRDQFKTIMRTLYGSNLSPVKMWQEMEIDYTANEVIAFSAELQDGELALAKKFKDFVINNCNPTETMYLDVDKEVIRTSCNHFFNKGETTIAYDLYDTATNSIKLIKHTDTIKVPNLERFRKYMVTGIIHRVDNQVEDNTVREVIETYGWALPIHDATILCCEAADFCRNIYCNGANENQPSLKHTYVNRNAILSNYFHSIGIPATAIAKWKEHVGSNITPVDSNFELNPMVLK